MKFRFAIIIMLILALPMTLAASSGLECWYNENAFIRQRIPGMERDIFEWVCQGENISSCVTYVAVGSEVLQTNPRLSSIEDFGGYSYFYPKGNRTRLVRVYFNSKELLAEEKYNFTTECSIEGSAMQAYYTVEFDPTYKTLDLPEYYMADYNSGSFFSYIVYVLILIVIGIILWWLVRRLSS